MSRTLGPGFATFLAVGLAPVLLRAASAGPTEARARWRDAQRLPSSSPWRERLRAYRAARAEAPDNDPVVARAAAAEGRVLRDAHLPHGAAAAEALAAAHGPRREPDRLAHALSAARALETEGDVTGASALLDDVVASGGSSVGWITAPALVLRARIAAGARDRAGLAHAVRDAADLVPHDVATRLELLDLAGMADVAAGSPDAARRVLAEQTRLYRVAEREGDAVADAAARAWLRLSLPKALEGR